MFSVHLGPVTASKEAPPKKAYGEFSYPAKQEDIKTSRQTVL